MVKLSLPSSTISAVIDDPVSLASNSGIAATLDQATVRAIIEGYISGFRILFIVNAGFAAVATVAGIILIKHKELRRPDEIKLKEEAARLTKRTEELERGGGSEPASHA